MRYTHHCIIVASALALLTCASPARAQAAPEDRVQKLEQQVKSMEETQKQILQLLQAQAGQQQKPAAAPAQGTPAAPPQQATEQNSKPAPAEKNFIPGAMLDVWYVPNEGDTKTIISSEIPMTRILDKGPFFSLLSFTSDKSLVTYKDKNLALRWSGYMKIVEGGKQLVILEAKFGSRDPNFRGARFLLRIDSNEIANLQYPISGNLQDGVLNTSATLDLDPGYYKYNLEYLPGRLELHTPDMN